MKSAQAQAAAAIRKELKEAFPNVKFRVRSSSASMMTSVHIEWVDGPTDKAVAEVVDKYEYGHFNPMEDLYEVSNGRDDIPQVKYIQIRRKMSDELYEQIAKQVEQEYNIDRNDEARCDELFIFGFHDHVYREFRNFDLSSRQV